MKHHLSLTFVLFASVSVSAFFLFHTQADALYYDDLEESSQVISVVCGEKITLKNHILLLTDADGITYYILKQKLIKLTVHISLHYKAI